jgi:hypothetical protein
MINPITTGMMMEIAKNRTMIFGPKSNGTYVVEFRTSRGPVARYLGAERRHRGAAALSGANILRAVRPRDEARRFRIGSFIAYN